MKAYIQPALRIERTEAAQQMMIAASIINDPNGNPAPADGSECFTNEQTPTTNVWDEEW